MLYRLSLALLVLTSTLFGPLVPAQAARAPTVPPRAAVAAPPTLPPPSGPVQDGVINPGEYGTHTNGQNQQTNGTIVWYMTWDATNLYVGITTANVAEGAVLYLDLAPLPALNGGTNTNGNLSGQNYDGALLTHLPFRADAVVYFKNGYREYRTADGAGAWSTATAGFGTYADNSGTNVRELAIPWSALGGQPTQFAWFGYVTSSGGFVYGQVPSNNASGTIGLSAVYNHYYFIGNTATGGTPPFARLGYAQNFDTLASTGTTATWTSNVTLPNWVATQFAGTLSTYRIDFGGTNSGAIYSYGITATAERALGSVSSGTPITLYYGYRFTNTTGAAISGFDIAYIGEQWRQGGNTTQPIQKLDFAYQLNATDVLSAGSWTDVDALDFTNPITGSVAANLDGNATANRATLTRTVNIPLNAGESVVFRFLDANDAGNDHGLGVDSFSVIAIPQGATADLALTKSGPAAVAVGTLFTYTLALSNTGASAGTNTIVTDTLPAAAAFVTFTTALTNVFTQPSANVLQWNLGDWPASSNGTIDVLAMITAGTPNGAVITNTAVITSSTAETSTANNTSAWPLTVYAPVLSIGKMVEPEVAVPYHGVVTYTVLLTNTGNAEAADVDVTDMLPAGTAFGGWVMQPGGANETGGAIAWTGTTNANSTTTFVFTATHTGNFEDVITNSAYYTDALTSGSANATFSVVSAGPNLDIVKTVTPNVNVPHNGPVTYTISLKNLGLGSATGVMLTDVLPVSTTFSTWITQPVGASESGGTLTWTGDAPASSQVDFVFVVDQNYPYGASVANTVVFEHESGGGDDTATFDVEPLYAVNFRYNDVEDVALTGEEVYMAGSFNGWSTTAFSLTANPAYSVFTGTLLLPAGTYQYKYVVKSGGDQWDWLNTNDRTVVVSDNITVEDYRNVVVGWANLNGPAAQTVLVNNPTQPISGQVYINNVTNPAGPGRAVRAQVGYGNAPTPASWAWANTVFDSQIGNNDVWRGTLTPTVTGVYSYATRYDGNWGVGNPNAGWAYGDLNGAPFSLDQAGVLTVTTLRIHDVQSTTHYSPYSGTLVSSISGIVTAKHTNGFYVQDPNPDADPRTSEGIFFFNSTAPAVNVGDMVVITGTVVEFISGSRPNDLPLTEISNPGRAFRVVSSGNPLPAPILLGNGGLTFITQTIADNRGEIGPGSAISNPTLYGVDFYEALEGMRLQINNAVVVGPTDSFSQSVVLADNGVNATGVRTPRGGILYTYADPQPERLMLDDEVFKGLGGLLMPLMHVSATIPGPIVGVLDYQFSAYRLQPSQLFTPTASPITQEVTVLTYTLPNQLLIAGFNVENLAGTDPQTKFDELGNIVKNRLSCPDILALQEIQDNNGTTNDGTVTSTVTVGRLVTAITTAGCPTYVYREVTPANNQDGGAPGGNIRVGFLFRTDRGLSFVDRPGAVATTTVTATVGATGVELSYSPGRIDPNNIYFGDSRKPLVGEFMFRGQKLFVIGNHFNSKGGDQPLFGRFQPPFRSTEISRTQQAIAVNNFVSHLRTLDPNVNVVVLGDINDFEFSPVVTTLKGDDLTDMFETLPVNERYSYVFEGNSQSLDHILVSNNLSTSAAYDPLHASAEFAFGVQVSDHDPDILLLTVPQPNLSTSGKTVNATSVAAGQHLTYTLTVINSGGGVATFNLTDTLSAQLTLVSAGGMTVNGQTLTATGTLAGGAQQAFTVVVQVSASFSGTLSNTATLTGDGQLRTLTAPNVTVSQLAPNLSTSSKTVNTTTVAAGQLVTYTLVVNNTGTGSATYTLTDTLNANLTVVNAGGMTVNGQTLTATGTLAAGAQMTYTVVVRVNIGFSGALTNTATLVGDGTTRALTAPTVNVTPIYITYLPRVTK